MAIHSNSASMLSEYMLFCSSSMIASSSSSSSSSLSLSLARLLQSASVGITAEDNKKHLFKALSKIFPGLHYQLWPNRYYFLTKVHRNCHNRSKEMSGGIGWGRKRSQCPASLGNRRWLWTSRSNRKPRPLCPHLADLQEWWFSKQGGQSHKQTKQTCAFRGRRKPEAPGWTEVVISVVKETKKVIHIFIKWFL